MKAHILKYTKKTEPNAIEIVFLQVAHIFFAYFELSYMI